MRGTVNFPLLQRTTLLVTIILAAVALLPDTVESGYVKLPLFVLGAGLLAALFMAAWTRTGGVWVPLPWVGLLVALHLLLFLASALWHYRAIHTWDSFLFAVGCLVFFWSGATLFPSMRETRRLYSVIEGLTAILEAVACVQLVLGDRLPVSFDLGEDQRIPSLLGNSTFFASYLVVVFPILLSQVLSGRSRGRARLFSALLAAGAAVLIGFTRTRSSVVGLAASIIVFGIMVPAPGKKKKAVGAAALLIAGAAVVLVLLLPGTARNALESVEGSHGQSLARRMYFWTAARDAFLSAPLAGSGIGGYEQVMLRFRSPDYWEARSEDVVPHAHNEIAEVAVEYGVPGLLLLGVTLLAAFRRGMALKAEPGNFRPWTSAGILAAVSGVAVDNLASVSLRQPPVAALVWLLLGLLWSGSLGHARGKRIPLHLPRQGTWAPVIAWAFFAVCEIWNATHVVEGNVHLLRALQGGNGNPRWAVSEYQAAVAADPANLVARSQLAGAFLAEGKWTDALRALDELQHCSPHYPKSCLMRAVALIRLGRVPEAVQSVEEELRHRSHPEAYLLAADLYRLVGDNRRQRDALLMVLRKDVEGKLPYGYTTACPRLAALSKTGEEKTELCSLMDSLQASVVHDPEFFRALKATGPG